MLETPSMDLIWQIFYKIGFANIATTLHGQDCLTVLVYHRIGDVNQPAFDTYPANISATPQMFARQMEYVARTFNVIDLDTMRRFLIENIPLPERPLLITFDDGYLDNYAYAFPVLKSYNLPAVIFLITDQIGNPNPPWWDECSYYFFKSCKQEVNLPLIGKYSIGSDKMRSTVRERMIRALKTIPSEERIKLMRMIQRELDVPEIPIKPNLFMSWDNVRTLVKHNIACQPHTVTHPIMRHIDDLTAKAELIESRNRIEAETNAPANVFAYPNGLSSDYDISTTVTLKECGYVMAFSMRRGPTRLQAVHDHPYEISRIFLGYWDNFELFLLKVHGFLGLLPRKSFLRSANH